MMNKKYVFPGILNIFFFLFIIHFTAKSDYTIKYLNNPSPGYILIGPQENGYLSLFDNSGKPVFVKNIKSYGVSANALRILDNGNVAFYTPSKWIIMDRELNVIDQISATYPYGTDFHTLRTAPNGNYLLVAHELMSIDMSEKVENGYHSATMLNNIIQEFGANKNLVFEWNCYEQIDILDATEDQDLTLTHIDPYHINSVYYDSDGNLLANFRNLDALIKINRSNGQIMWILGGSKSKRNQFTFINDTENGFKGFSHQHDPKRLPNGNILLFDNGNLKPVQFSRAVEYSINESVKTVTKVWEYRHPTGVFASFQGNAERLPSGNTIISWGMNSRNMAGTEINSDGNILMEIDLGGNTYTYQVLRKVLMMDAVSRTISNPAVYSFNELHSRTGLSLEIETISGSGVASVEKHKYAPHYISYSDEKPCLELPYRWVLNYRGISSITGKIYFDLSDVNVGLTSNEMRIFWRKNEGTGSFVGLETIYNSSTNRLEAVFPGNGEYMLGIISNKPPLLMSPANDTKNIDIKTILSWSSSPGTGSFLIQVSMSEDFEELVFEKQGYNKKTIEVSGLKNNSKYFWRVKGNVSPCDKLWSDIYSFTTGIAKPELTHPSNDAHDIELTGKFDWKEVQGAKEYGLLVSEYPSFNSFIVNQPVGDSAFFEYSGLKPLTLYYWKVYASSDLITRKWSLTKRFKTGCGKPILISPKNLSTGMETDGILKWESINSVNMYRIQLSDNPLFVTNIIDTIVDTDNHYYYSGLENSSKYYWRIKGIFKDTATNWSETREFRTIIGQPVLFAPENGTKEIGLNGQMEWSILTNASNYKVQVSTDSDFEVLVYDTVVGLFNFTYNNLSYGEKYYWRVTGFDGISWGYWSDTYSFYTIPIQNLPRNNEYQIPLETTLEWKETENVKFYELRIEFDNGFTDDSRIFSKIKKNEFLIENLVNNTTYFWSVRYLKSNGYSNWSEPFSFTTKLSSPVLHSTEESTIESMKDFDLIWDATEGRDFYQLQLASDRDFNFIIYEDDNIVDEQITLNLNFAEPEYFWRVKAYNTLNASDWSSNGSFKISPATNVFDSEPVIALNLYPNPGNSQITFEFYIEKPGLLQIQIFDILGNKIKSFDEISYGMGEHSIAWDARDEKGDKCQSGYYHLIIIGPISNISIPFLLMK